MLVIGVLVQKHFKLNYATNDFLPNRNDEKNINVRTVSEVAPKPRMRSNIDQSQTKILSKAATHRLSHENKKTLSPFYYKKYFDTKSMYRVPFIHFLLKMFYIMDFEGFFIFL